MILVICLLLLLTAGSAYQAWDHARRLAQIPVRIHVNGSRGKSSVTRLIAAGLRAGGIRTIAKTTGTKPRFIYSDGTEVPVVRAGKPNIIEQVRIVRRTSELGAHALVVECMAIKPELQTLLEDRMIRSTHSVLTNVRADHLDEMGPTLPDVARNLGRTIPRNGMFFTAERTFLPVLCERAVERGSTVSSALPESVTEEMLSKFSYVEHPDNVALALAVCNAFGVDTRVALDGMTRALPDPGVMQIHRVNDGGREMVFINAFAANDPDSYVLAWERLATRMPDPHRLVALVVCRPDRIERSLQMGELAAKRLPVHACIAAGKETAPFLNRFRRAAGNGRVAVDMNDATAPEVYAAVTEFAGETPLVVFGIGNIVGWGEEIVAEFSRMASTGGMPRTMPGEVSGV